MAFPVRLCVDGVAHRADSGKRKEVAGIWCSKFVMAATALEEKGARSLVLKVRACFFFCK